MERETQNLSKTFDGNLFLYEFNFFLHMPFGFNDKNINEFGGVLALMTAIADDEELYKAPSSTNAHRKFSDAL